MFFEETSSNYIPKHPNQHPSLYFGSLAPLSQNSQLEDFMQGYFSFLEKYLFNCKLFI
jgi:hypothetical protein